MYFKKKSSRMQRQAETPNGQNTTIPRAFLLFLIFPHTRGLMDRKTHIPMMLRGRRTAIISICRKMKNRRKLFNLQRLKVVGLTGFEPANRIYAFPVFFFIDFARFLEVIIRLHSTPLYTWHLIILKRTVSFFT